ncbi:MAG: hypothetical protein H7Y19_04555 [Luteimonas sp.]|nr:hypothetical protein [Luteimonas sp.]
MELLKRGIIKPRRAVLTAKEPVEDRQSMRCEVGADRQGVVELVSGGDEQHVRIGTGEMSDVGVANRNQLCTGSQSSACAHADGALARARN